MNNYFYQYILDSMQTGSQSGSCRRQSCAAHTNITIRQCQPQQGSVLPPITCHGELKSMSLRSARVMAIGMPLPEQAR